MDLLILNVTAKCRDKACNPQPHAATSGKANVDSTFSVGEL